MADPFKEWAVLELFGHRKFAGLVTEVELAGERFIRIDVPSEPPVTQVYGGKAIYCITPTDEATCRGFSVGNRPEPISRWELNTPRALVRGDIVDADEVDELDDGYEDDLAQEDA